MKRLPPADPKSPAKLRLQKFLAMTGVAGRREAEVFITQGRVRVNGAVVRTLPAFVDPRSDRVEFDGREVRALREAVVIALHKPARTLVTKADGEGLDRATVLELVDHPARAALVPAGRLDWDTAGLLILTTDGELVQRLTHPRFGVVKTYLASVKGTVTPEHLAAFARHARLFAKRAAMEARRARRERGASTAGVSRKRAAWLPPSVRVLEAADGRTKLEIRLVDARSTPLREVLFAAGMSVRTLSRVGIGGFGLRGLAVGKWRVLRDWERALLLEPPIEPMGDSRTDGEESASQRPPRTDGTIASHGSQASSIIGNQRKRRPGSRGPRPDRRQGRGAAGVRPGGRGRGPGAGRSGRGHH
jgi:pseudouridine synthase